MLVSTAYFPNIQNFAKLLEGAKIESHENFVKQTYRNRCEVLSDKGVQTLTVPILWRHGQKMPILEVQIDNSSAWWRIHLRAIRSYYAGSAYFDHFFPHIEACLSTKYESLLELNTATTELMARLFKKDLPIVFTDTYAAAVPLDFRTHISPKASQRKADASFTAPQYYQVFNDRMDFVANLSTLDYLLCNGRWEL